MKRSPKILNENEKKRGLKERKEKEKGKMWN